MGLLVITPPTTTARELQCLPALFAAGLRTLHIRKPGGTRSEMQAYMNQVPKMYRNRLVLHDHHDLAAAGAGGIHFPERSLPAGLIAAPPGLTVSLSLHQLPQLGVCRGQVDYCFLAPIYASITKPGHCPPLELADRRALSDAVLTSCAPVIALGGVTPASFEELAGWGFAGAALLGTVWESEDPVAALAHALHVYETVDWNVR